VQTYGNRWYDKYPELSKYIEKLKDLKERKRDKILLQMMQLIIEYDDKLIDKHILDFPIACRRWYDKEASSWLVINALKYANEDLINEITLYLKEKL